MDTELNCVADGTDLVWEYVFELCTGVKLPPHFWTYSHDNVCGTVEHPSLDECVPRSTVSDATLIRPHLVLISILSNTVARIGAVSH